MNRIVVALMLLLLGAGCASSTTSVDEAQSSSLGPDEFATVHGGSFDMTSVGSGPTVLFFWDPG